MARPSSDSRLRELELELVNGCSKTTLTAVETSLHLYTIHVLLNAHD